MDKMREWTNEKHENFLNSIEASFVRAMFADGAVNNNQQKHEQQKQDPSSHNNCLLRLDRFLPDSCDSTQDLPTQRRTSSSYATSKPSDNMTDTNRRSTVKSERRTRRLSRSQQQYGSLQDQVVPEADELRRRE